MKSKDNYPWEIDSSKGSYKRLAIALVAIALVVGIGCTVLWSHTASNPAEDTLNQQDTVTIDDGATTEDHVYQDDTLIDENSDPNKPQPADPPKTTVKDPAYQGNAPIEEGVSPDPGMFQPTDPREFDSNDITRDPAYQGNAPIGGGVNIEDIR